MGNRKFQIGDTVKSISSQINLPTAVVVGYYGDLVLIRSFPNETAVCYTPTAVKEEIIELSQVPQCWLD